MSRGPDQFYKGMLTDGYSRVYVPPNCPPEIMDTARWLLETPNGRLVPDAIVRHNDRMRHRDAPLPGCGSVSYAYAPGRPTLEMLIASGKPIDGLAARVTRWNKIKMRRAEIRERNEKKRQEQLNGDALREASEPSAVQALRHTIPDKREGEQAAG